MTSSELFALAGAIGEEVRGKLGVKIAGSRGGFDLAEVLTSSPEAYRHYAAGELALHESSYTNAIRSFGRAIQEDPSFAMAYYRLGMAQVWNAEIVKAVSTFEIALSHGENLPDHWKTVIRGFADAHANRFNSGYEPINAMVSKSTDIPDAYYLLGEILFHGDRYRDLVRATEVLERAMELDPTYHIVTTHLFDGYLASDDAKSIERLITALRAENRFSEAALYGECLLFTGQGRGGAFQQSVNRLLEEGMPFTDFVEVVQGIGYRRARNWDLAEQTANALVESDVLQNRVSGYDIRGMAQISRGKLIAGLKDWDKLHELQESQGMVEIEIAARRSQTGMLLLEAGDTSGALDALQRFETPPFVGYIHYSRGTTLYRLGRRSDGDKALSALNARARESQSPMVQSWLRLLTAEKHIAQNEPMQAIQEVEASMRMHPAHRARRQESLVLARAYAASGDLESAIGAYREFLKPPYLTVKVLVEEIPALYELALLEEEAGYRDSARDHYRQYLDHWGNADLPIVNVPNARTRLEALNAKL